MATRTQARESVIGLLYAVDLGNDGIVKFIDDILEEKKIRNKQKIFALKLFNGVIDNLEDINEHIIAHLKQGTIKDTSCIDKAILRLAIYEILFEDLDRAIIINEAIELAKRLASDTAPKFINAILDKVTKA